MESIPVFQRGGSIVPKRMRARRSTVAMEHDPFTLIVALDNQHAASGSLYLDDGASFDYQQGAFVKRRFRFAADGSLRAEADAISVPGLTGTTAAVVAGEAKPAPAEKSFSTALTVERIVILGAPKAFTKATLTVAGEASRDLTLEHATVAGTTVLTVRKPDAPIARDWSIQFA